MADPQDTNPHGSSKFASSVGSSTLGNFLEFQFRPYSHDLLNKNQGFLPYSESQKWSGSARYYQDNNKWEINRISLFRMSSLKSYNSITKPLSYFFDIGLESTTIRNHSKNVILTDEISRRVTPINGELLLGYSLQDNNKNNSPYVISLLGGLKAQGHQIFKNDIRMGPEIAFNFIYSISRIKVQFYSAYYYYLIMQNKNEYQIALRLRYEIEQNHEIRIEFAKYMFYQEMLLGYHYHF